MNQIKNWSDALKLVILFVVILVISMLVPMLGLIASLFLALPIIIFTSKNDLIKSTIFLLSILLISLVIGGVLGLQLTTLLGIPGFILGNCIKRQESRLFTYFTGTVTLLITMVINYVLVIYLFNINLVDKIMDEAEKSFEQTNQLYQQMGIQSLNLDFNSIESIFVTMTPLIFLIFSAILMFVIEVVNYPIAKKFGVSAKAWPNFSTFMLPKSLFWYYIVVLVLSLIFTTNQGDFLHSFLVNFEIVLQLLFYLQGISFICYYSKEKHWSSLIPILVVIFSLVMPIFMYIIRLLGIIDLGFDLRKFMKSKR